MKLLAFDLEISALIPDDATDWKQYRPLGITCAAAAWQRSDGTMIIDTWHAGMFDDHYAPRMTQGECKIIVYALMAAVRDGYTLLTHNGVSFDFDILAEESGMLEECRELAMNSVDTCLQIHCIKGFPVGLDAIAKGMGIKGKIEGMDGAKAPVMWHDGEYDKVLAYVAQDARCTLEVALAIEKQRLFRWISKTGRLKTQFMPRLMPVREALQLPFPHTEWMTEPISRWKSTEWMKVSEK